MFGKSFYASLLLAGSLVRCSSSDVIDVDIKRGSMPGGLRHVVRFNGEEVFCECGKVPVMFIFSRGNPLCFCEQHIPEIDIVRPIGKHEVDELLRSMGTTHNLNGAYRGQ